MPSLSARQSPLGLSAPPAEIFGEFGMALRLNWLMGNRRETIIRGTQYLTPFAFSASDS